MDVIFLKSLRPLYCDYISRILCVRRAQQGRPLCISTPAPTRGATLYGHWRYLLRYRFLLAPLHEGRRRCSVSVPRRGLFLLAPLHEGRHARPADPGSPRPISTRAPTRGATLFHTLAPFYYIISTHAPTRGSTKRRFQFRLGLSISTRAPTRGATCRSRAS